jgi:NAD(P)-dependent dehydrogenase (short-subunit alcohol dehydrogenase family)
MCIAPGTVESRFHTSGGMTPERAASYYAASASTHPLGRIGTPDDVAEMAAVLLDDVRAGWCTGSVVTVDGGRLLTMTTALQLSSGGAAPA